MIPHPPVKIDGGLKCPLCKGLMQRYEHPKEWRPRPGKPHYFIFWDRCMPCARVQHYRKAKRENAEYQPRAHPNGAPLFSASGMMLYDKGNRSVFDDVDK